MNYLTPVIYCQNDGVLMRFPYPNPPKKSESPPEYPKDTFRKIFLCHECGHGYEYTARDVHWKDFQTQAPTPLHTRTAVFLVRFLCAQEGCESLIELYTVREHDKDKSALWKEVALGTFHAKCSKGHSIVVPPHEGCVIYPVEGLLK